MSLSSTSGYAYLASPYSKTPLDTEEGPIIRHDRYTLVTKALVWLAVEKHLTIYSPIVHWHWAVQFHALPTDAAFWKNQNETMIDGAEEIIVLQISNWDHSLGVKMEMDYAKENKILVRFLTPQADGTYILKLA